VGYLKILEKKHSLMSNACSKLNKLIFVFLLVFALFDALVCLINLVIWRLHFKNNLTKYSSRRNSRLVLFILEFEKVFG
jgi:hypothetical protein